ncbi:hypothetical protein Nepgr_015016 [Nepenthes gracilis]|uniref:Major facilitator superfamily (MFS) profile domain-containing protein n=1 Tax=Nepenthes gracilis TaxID=150966 RepID=A0AAD3SKB6_NEPGR|nr:hypothetical protein Nepgr_015016 [Nepenthes gracilis]
MVGYSSPAESGIVDDLHLSTAEYSLFGSLLTIGGAIGAIVSGRLADYLGRRLTLGVTDLFAIIGWLSIAVSQTAWSLDLGRLLLGISLGLTAYVVPVYVAEITPKDRRGQFVVFHMFMIVTGISVAFLLGVILSWRLLAVVGIIPSLVQLIGVFMIPESPRWLAKIGKSDEFEAALQRLRGVNVDITEEAAEIKEYTDSLKQISEVNILQLFQRKYAYVLTVGVGLFALSQLMGTNGILYYASSVFESAGFSGHVGSIALAVIQIPAVFVPVVCMDKFGRRVLLMVSAAGLCFGCFLAGLAYVFEDFGLLKGVSPYMVLIGVLIYAFMYPVGMGATIFLIIAEIYPLNIKGLAGSMATLAGWLCSWFVAYTFNFSMEWSSGRDVFYISGHLCFHIAVYCGFGTGNERADTRRNTGINQPYLAKERGRMTSRYFSFPAVK